MTYDEETNLAKRALDLAQSAFVAARGGDSDTLAIGGATSGAVGDRRLRTRDCASAQLG